MYFGQRGETAVHLQIIEAIRVYILMIDSKGESRIIKREKRDLGE